MIWRTNGSYPQAGLGRSEPWMASAGALRAAGSMRARGSEPWDAFKLVFDHGVFPPSTPVQYTPLRRWAGYGLFPVYSVYEYAVLAGFPMSASTRIEVEW